MGFSLFEFRVTSKRGMNNLKWKDMSLKHVVDTT